MAERLLEIEQVLNSPAWQRTRAIMMKIYLSKLKSCPVTDDLQRFRLAEALNVLDFVENHLRIAHSGGEVEAERLVKADFAFRKSFFKRS